MWNMILQFARTKYLSIITKVNIKDITSTTEKIINKVSEPINKIKKELKPLKKESRWQTWFPFSFVYGQGKFQPLYFMVTLFCFLAASMLYTKIHAASVAIKKGTFNSEMISTADLGVVLGFISSLILLYNSNKKSAPSELSKSSNENKEE